jgi:hypothetical protein
MSPNLWPSFFLYIATRLQIEHRCRRTQGNVQVSADALYGDLSSRLLRYESLCLTCDTAAEADTDRVESAMPAARPSTYNVHPAIEYDTIHRGKDHLLWRVRNTGGTHSSSAILCLRAPRPEASLRIDGRRRLLEATSHLSASCAGPHFGAPATRMSGAAFVSRHSSIQAPPSCEAHRKCDPGQMSVIKVATLEPFSAEPRLFSREDPALSLPRCKRRIRYATLHRMRPQGLTDTAEDVDNVLDTPPPSKRLIPLDTELRLATGVTHCWGHQRKKTIRDRKRGRNVAGVMR